MRPSRGLFVERRMFVTAAAAIGLALAGGAAAAESKCKVGRIAEWPLRAEYYRPVVAGAINGEKIGILLDTGAGMSLFLRSAAATRGLTRYEAPGYRALVTGGVTRPEIIDTNDFCTGQSVRKK